MKSLIVCLSVLAFAFTPSNAFLSNLIGSITGSIGNAVNTVTDTINTALIAGQFLWDNALQPSLQVLQDNSLNFIDNYFGNILNAIGKRSVDRLQIEAQKNFISDLFLSQTNNLIANLKTMFLTFLNDVKVTIQSNLINIVLGQTDPKQLLAELINKVKTQVLELVQQTISNIITPARSFNLDGLASQLGNIVNQMGNLVLNQFNELLSTLALQVLG